MSLELSTLRTELKLTFEQLLDEGNTSNADVVAHVRRKHPKLIKRLSTELEIIAMKRILNDITRKTTKISAQVGQKDLFENISGVPSSFSVRASDGQIVKKKFGAIPLHQLIDATREKANAARPNNSQNLLDSLEELANEVGSKNLTFDNAVTKLKTSASRNSKDK